MKKIGLIYFDEWKDLCASYLRKIKEANVSK